MFISVERRASRLQRANQSEHFSADWRRRGYSRVTPQISVKISVGTQFGRDFSLFAPETALDIRRLLRGAFNRQPAPSDIAPGCAALRLDGEPSRRRREMAPQRADHRPGSRRTGIQA